MRRIVLGLLDDVGDFGYSRRNIERALVADVFGRERRPHSGTAHQRTSDQAPAAEFSRNDVPARLAQQPAVGALAFIGYKGVRELIDRLADEGLLRVVPAELDSTPYDRLEITDEGRAFL